VWEGSVSDGRRTSVQVAVRVVRRIEAFLPVALIIALGTSVLLIAAAEEPYHIDELRQVRSYDRDLAGVVMASIQQEQPPLDAVLNSLAQKVLGIGDVRQRFLSVLFGVGSLGMIAILTLRSGFTTLGTVSAIGVMSLTPALTGVTAYARPYALPVFLMLSFLVLAGLWLRRGRVWALLLSLIVAGSLPWSRTVEPVIFLAVTGTLLLVMAIIGDNRQRATWLVGATAAGIAASVPAFSLLSGELGDRTASGSSVAERLSRLVLDVPSTISSALPYWPVLGVIVIVGIALPAARQSLKQLWWWWALVGTALGFVVAFVVLAPPTQPFFGRYLFTWVPPAAVMVGAVVSAAMTHASDRWTVTSGLTTVVAGLLVAWGGIVTWQDLSTRSTADWKTVSEILVGDLQPDTAILYDQLRPLGDYRTPFAGYPRYTKDHPRIPLSLSLIQNPSALAPGSNTAVVLLSGGRAVDVPGWVGMGVDRFFTIFLPTTPRPGLKGAAKSAEEFAEALGPTGAALRLTAASLWLEAGEPDRADDVIEDLLADEDLRPEVLTAIDGSALERHIVSVSP